MKTIKQIKQECIEIDLSNLSNIGTVINGKYCTFTTKLEVELFYLNINLKDLLKIYSEYMGLKCLEKEEGLEEHGYTINILDLIENL